MNNKAPYNCFIVIQRAVRAPWLPLAHTVRSWLQQALCLCPPTLSYLPKNQTMVLTVRWVGAAEGQALNKQYRGKNSPTNILSFCYPEQPLGDLVVCAPVLYQECTKPEQTLTAHAAHLLIHGYLHLLGYDHEKRLEQQQMEALEIKILNALGFDDPY